jgi:pyrimidine deaminase RibD-like protein
VNIKIERVNFFMEEALRVSKLALPECLPNPPVGCVLVKDDSIIATGYTDKPGSLHAEAYALSKVSGELKSVTAFVTLEPCSFFGRTPSCAHALVERGLRSIFVALLDSDPRNNGKGIQILKDAGINVELGILSEKVNSFIKPYLNS